MKNKKMSLHEWFVKYQSDNKVFDKAVKLWFLESQTGTNGFDIDHMRFLLERYNNAIVLKETEKAILIKEYYEEEVQGFYEVSYRLQSIEEWLPKSVLIDEWEEPDKKMINYSYHTYLLEMVENLCTKETMRTLKTYGEGAYKGYANDAFIHRETSKELERCLKKDKVIYLKKADFAKALRY